MKSEAQQRGEANDLAYWEAHKSDVTKDEQFYYFQDGRMFFDATTGKVVAVYVDTVTEDFDHKGAMKARAMFLADYPFAVQETN